MGERGWQWHSQPRKPDWLCPAQGCVWGGVAAVHVSVGGVLFALVAWQLLGYWRLSQLLVGAVWACLGSGSHWQSETRPHSAQRACQDPGTQGWLVVLGRAGRGCGWHKAHPEGSHLRDWARDYRGVCGRGCFLGVSRRTLFLVSSWLGSEVYALLLLRPLGVQEG